MRDCSVEGCARSAATKRRRCRMHQSRLERTGSVGPATPLIRRYAADEICSVTGCERRPTRRGLCGMHADRVDRGGDTGPVGRLIQLPGTPRDDGNGYILVVRKRQHRLVMEHLLGRPLLPSETVHHRNGDRSDNRPENLELWSSSQPPGQRVADKVAWAREILDLYDPECGLRGLPEVAKTTGGKT